MARRFHLFPFRTEKLSFATPMVLRTSGRVGSRRFREVPRQKCSGAFFVPVRERQGMVLQRGPEAGPADAAYKLAAFVGQA